MPPSSPPYITPQLVALLGPHRWRLERMRRLRPLDGRWSSLPPADLDDRGWGCTLAWLPGPAAGLARRGPLTLAWRGELRRSRKERPLQALEQPHGPAADAALLALISTYGTRACERIDGPVALLTWDADRRQLVAARDRFGLVPLLCHRPDHGSGAEPRLVLSTDPKVIAALMAEAPRPRMARLRGFVAWREGDLRADFLEGVDRLRAAERMVVEPGGSRIDTWWTPPTSYDPPEADGGDALRARGVIDEVVGSRLGLAPSAVCMSGGLDSPALAATLARQGGHHRDNPLLVASQIAPGFPSTDESAEIHLLEQALSLEVHRFSITRYATLATPETFLGHLVYGPQIHPGEEYQGRFLAWMRERLGQVQPLKGVGADDVLGATEVEALVWLLARRDVAGLRALARRGVGHRRIARAAIRQLVDRAGLRPLVGRTRAALRHQPSAPVPWSRPQDWVPGVATVPAPAPGSNRWLDMIQGWGWEGLCRGIQREDAAAGVISGFPYLDRRLWECFWRIPPPRLHQPGLDRPVLRRAVSDRLPAAIVERPKSTFFDAVVIYGLVGQHADVVRRLFAASRLADLGLIEPMRFLQAFEAFCHAGQGSWRWERPVGHAAALWPTIAAELWVRALLEGPEVVRQAWEEA